MKAMGGIGRKDTSGVQKSSEKEKEKNDLKIQPHLIRGKTLAQGPKSDRVEIRRDKKVRVMAGQNQQMGEGVQEPEFVIGRFQE